MREQGTLKHTVHAALRLTLALALLGASGCVFDWSYDDDGWGDDGYSSSTRYVNAEQASLTADLGEVSVEGDARIHDAYDYGYGASIEIRNQGRDGVGMNRLDLDGMSLEDVEPGYYVSEAYEYESDQPNFSVLGCSGPEDDYWEYDQTADLVEVQVTDLGGGQRRLDWTATFDDFGEISTSRGSIVVR